MAILTNINGKFSVSNVGAVTFNNAFTFPTADGTANYVLKTNGSGQLSWAPDSDSGGDITGSGTANTVTKFTGAKTIGDGPITFSSNDSTFAGSVTIGTGIIKPNIGGDIAITQGAIGLRINDAASAISPTTATSNNDNAVDLGVSNIRFRNLYMGGTGTFGGSITGTSAQFIDTSNPSATSGSVIIEGRRDGGANVLTLRAKDASAPSSALPADQGAVLRWQGFDGTDFENMGYIYVASDGQAVANADAPSYMSFGTSGDGSSTPSERMRIDSSGNVGIGTNSPDEPLHLSQAAANTFFKIEAYADTQGADAGINVAREQVTGSDSNLSFWTNTGSALTQKMSITSGGNVAIGGTLGADSQFRVELKPAATILAGLRIGYQSTSNNYFDGDNQYFRNGLGSVNRMVIDSSGNSNFYGTIKSFNTGAAHLILNGDTNNSGDSGEIDAIIDFRGDGNPGLYGYRINTENWSGQTALNFQEYLNGSYTSRLFISKDGNVVIGATSSSSKLKVEGPNTSSNPLVDLVASGTGSFQRGVRLLNGGMNAGDEIMYSVGRSDNTRNMGQMYFHYVGNGSTSNRISMGLHGVDDVFNIAGTGNVGIGTTSPSAKLHVKSGSVNLLHVGGICNNVGVNLSATDITSGLEASFTVKGNVSYHYTSYTQSANAYTSIFDLNGTPAGIYQLNLCTTTDASSYGVFTIKWSGTAGTVINTLVSGGTNGGYGLSFSGTVLRSIANVQTDTAANLQCLVTVEAPCQP